MFDLFKQSIRLFMLLFIYLHTNKALYFANMKKAILHPNFNNPSNINLAAIFLINFKTFLL